MESVRFSLDDLNVESFYTTESGPRLRGTVVGYTDPTISGGLPCDCTPEESEATPTCMWYFSCDQACDDPETYIACGESWDTPCS